MCFKGFIKMIRKYCQMRKKNLSIIDMCCETNSLKNKSSVIVSNIRTHLIKLFFDIQNIKQEVQIFCQIKKQYTKKPPRNGEHLKVEGIFRLFLLSNETQTPLTSPNKSPIYIFITAQSYSFIKSHVNINAVIFIPFSYVLLYPR